MNIDCFLKRYPEFLMNDKDDGISENIKLLAGGTTSARIAKLLNFAVSQMDDSECYLEVGVFTGSTLCSAGYVNEKHCIGIDNYLPEHMIQMTHLTPEQIQQRCQLNINCMLPRKSKLIVKDFRQVTPEEIGMPVAVSFIDGTHDYTSVLENLYWLEPILADHAILIFDDINYIEVSLAIERWMNLKAPNYDMMAYVKPYYGHNGNNVNLNSLRDRFINNGVCVMRYHRDPTSNTFTYDPAKIGYSKEQLEGEPAPC